MLWSGVALLTAANAMCRKMVLVEPLLRIDQVNER